VAVFCWSCWRIAASLVLEDGFPFNHICLSPGNSARRAQPPLVTQGQRIELADASQHPVAIPGEEFFPFIRVASHHVLKHQGN